MRKAICHYSFHRRWKKEKWTPDRLAEEVKSLGVEGVDFHVGSLGDPSEAPELIISAIEKHGLVLSGLSLSNNFNQENGENFRREIDTVKQWIPAAVKVKAPVSRIFGGHLSAEQRGDLALKEASRQRVLDALGELVKEAEKAGLIFALENHGGLPCTGEEQVEIIEAINSPSLKATIDVGNYMQGGQEGHIGTKIAAKHAAYVHFKDFKKLPDPSASPPWDLKSCIVGEGDVDHRTCIQILRQVGFDGFVALEYEGVEDEMIGVPRSVEYMNEVL